jgi:hypothetical protein
MHASRCPAGAQLVTVKDSAAGGGRHPAAALLPGPAERHGGLRRRHPSGPRPRGVQAIFETIFETIVCARKLAHKYT